MVDARGLHRAISCGIGFLIVGGFLYLLQVDVPVRYSKIEEAGPPPSVDPVRVVPRNARQEVRPASLDPTGTEAVREVRAGTPSARPLEGPTVSAARVSRAPEAQPAIKPAVRSLTAPDAVVKDALGPGTVVHNSVSFPQRDLRSQTPDSSTTWQPASVAETLSPDRVVVSTALETLSPPPSLPLRRPSPRPLAKAETTKKAIGSRVASHAEPMRLGAKERQARADERQARAKERQARASPSPRRYQTTVWAALARNKPSTQQRGSATVSFGINARGGLAFVRLARSSGNRQIDRLAVATVRRAAPFPAPPKELQARPYTIRIDFH